MSEVPSLTLVEAIADYIELDPITSTTQLMLLSEKNAPGSNEDILRHVRRHVLVLVAESFKNAEKRGTFGPSAPKP